MASQSPQDAPYGADAPDGDDYMHFLETMLERLSSAFYSKDTAPPRPGLDKPPHA